MRGMLPGLWASWVTGRQAGSCSCSASLDMPADIEAYYGLCSISSPAVLPVCGNPAEVLQGAACLPDGAPNGWRRAGDACIISSAQTASSIHGRDIFHGPPNSKSEMDAPMCKKVHKLAPGTQCAEEEVGVRCRTCQNTTKISTNPMMVHARPSTVILRSIKTPSSASVPSGNNPLGRVAACQGGCHLSGPQI